MYTHSRSIAATALVVIALTVVVVGSASANRLAFNSSDFYMIWEDEDQRLTSEPAETACEVTLLGSFHTNTIEKVEGLLIGSITHVSVDEAGCLNGTGRAYDETLPWLIRFVSFEGTLPTIDGVTLAFDTPEFLFDAPDLGASCNTTPGVGTAIGTASIAAGVITGLAPDEDVGLPIDDLPGSIVCDLIGAQTYSGTASVEDGNGGDVDIGLEGIPPVDRANLAATPSNVTVTDLEQNDVFVVRNTDGDATATTIRPTVIAADREAPEFSVRSATCTETLGPGESCTYTVVVNSRPEREGRVRLGYHDGTEARSTTVEVDIES